MTTPTTVSAELPEALRVPLDSLHADAGYLCGRLLNGSLTQEQVVASIRRRIDAAKLAAQALSAAQAGVPAVWKLKLPGGKHTDEWESARVGDYNRGWNDYRKSAISVLSKITTEDQVCDGWAKASQWLRNNYQDHPNIASLCDAMLVAANTPTPVVECTCKAEDMPFGRCCKALQSIPPCSIY